MNEDDELVLPSFKPDPTIFYHYFGRKSAFDRPEDQERKIPEISDEAFDRLNRSARTGAKLEKSDQQRINPQTTKRPKFKNPKRGSDVKAICRDTRQVQSGTTDPRRAKIPKENLIPDQAPSCASAPLKRDVVYVVETTQNPEPRDRSQDFINCVEERANRRRLNDYMKAHQKSSMQWDTTYQEPPKLQKTDPYIPSKPPKRERTRINVVDSSAPRSTILRSQTVRQSLALREACAEIAEKEEAEYREKVHRINTEMTPYIKFVEDLEKRKDDKQWDSCRRDDAKRMKSLKEIVDRTAKAVPLFLSNARAVEAQSRLNGKMRQNKRSPHV